MLSIVDFADAATEDVYEGRPRKAARKVLPQNLMAAARRKLFQIATVSSLDELRVPPGNRLEALRGERVGQYSIRINDRYRICFRWNDGNPDQIQIVDYH